jgi:phosphonatase-like hydrolase
MTRRPRLAVLDMIGTTVRAGDEVADAFREAFARAGVALTDADISGVRGRSKQEATADLVAARLPGVEEPADAAAAIYEHFRAALRRRYETASRPVDGARAAIDALLAAGIDVVLTTGLDRDTADLILRGVGWTALGIRGVLTGDDVARGRPAPDLIEAAMAMVGVTDAAEVLVVGDTIADLEAGAAAGAGWNVGVTSGAHPRVRLETCPHTVLLGSVAELRGWLALNASP